MNASENDLIFIFLTGSALLLLLGIAIVVFVFFYQRRVMRQQIRLQSIESEHKVDLIRSMLETQEKERRRIAKDLHDEVGALLSAAKLNLDMLARRSVKKSLAPEDLKEVGSSVGDVIGDLRRISHDLMPPSLETGDLPAALRLFLHKVEKNSGISCTLSSNQEDVKLDPETKRNVYRLIQELTQNSLKHSKCDQIKVDIEAGFTQIQLSYSDNGRGFDVNQARNSAQSLGLKSLESRATALNASLDIESESGKGMQASLHLSKQV